MARRKRFGLTSADRYRLKAFRVHYLPGIPEDLVKTVSDNQTASFTAGFGIFNRLWKEKVVKVLEDNRVPAMHRGIYRGFLNEYVGKVMIRGSATKDEIIEKWTGLGADARILREIVDTLGEIKIEHEEARAPAAV